MKLTTVEIFTPEHLFLKKEEVEFVVIPGHEGELGILPGHMDLQALLVSGEVRITSENTVKKYEIASGYAQIGAESVKVFTTSAKASN